MAGKRHSPTRMFLSARNDWWEEWMCHVLRRRRPEPRLLVNSSRTQNSAIAHKTETGWGVKGDGRFTSEAKKQQQQQCQCQFVYSVSSLLSNASGGPRLEKILLQIGQIRFTQTFLAWSSDSRKDFTLFLKGFLPHVFFLIDWINTCAPECFGWTRGRVRGPIPLSTCCATDKIPSISKAVRF